MSALVRERGLALVALVLALVGLATGGGHAGIGRRVAVVAAIRSLPAGSVLRPGSVGLVRIDARDLAPGMARRLTDALGRRLTARLAKGDYVVRGVLGGPDGGLALRPGERAVPLSLETTSAPPLALLHPGARVDVVSETDATRSSAAGSDVIAHAVPLLVAGRSGDGGLVVTVRAPLQVALRLVAAQAQARPLRLLALPEVSHG